MLCVQPPDAAKASPEKSIDMSPMLLLGSQNDFPFIYAGAVAGPDIGNENKSTLVGVPNERSYPPSIVPDWEKKSCSFCILLSIPASEVLLACLCLEFGGVAVCPVKVSCTTWPAFFGVLSAGLSDPARSTADLMVGGDGRPGCPAIPGDVGD